MSRTSVNFSMTIALAISSLVLQPSKAVEYSPGDGSRNIAQQSFTNLLIGTSSTTTCKDKLLLAQVDPYDSQGSSLSQTSDMEGAECPRRQQEPASPLPPRKQRRSALSLREKKPMPPQYLDFTKYDDIIELECEQKRNYLKFADTRFANVVKVKVRCRLETRNNQWAPETKFQELWFNQGLPVGSKHFTSFPIKPRHEIGIFLKTGDRTMGDAEIAACAGALVQLRLQSTLNANMISTVRIPSYMFERMKLELAKQNFVSYRDNSLSITTLIPIPLETDLGNRETMCFLR
ncbi:MAG: hypothetical protein K2Z81_05200 [Cyanobacteria bacterium]|nr:hypothetical protein [Cyanobacteriota bacterium]